MEDHRNKYVYEKKALTLAPKEIVENAICEEVYPDEYEDIKKLGQDMIKFCVENGGAGLAAPQVGVMKRMFVWNNASNQYQIVINPFFTPDDAKKTNVVEGCLTYKDEHYFLKRYKSGNARFDVLDPKDKTKFKRAFKKVSGERAFIWQHELDHINGKTIAMIGKLFAKN